MSSFLLKYSSFTGCCYRLANNPNFAALGEGPGEGGRGDRERKGRALGEGSPIHLLLFIGLVVTLLRSCMPAESLISPKVRQAGPHDNQEVPGFT